MRTAVVGLAFLGLLALVAAGSSGDGWGGGVEERHVPGAFLDYAFTLSILLVLALAVIAVWAFTGPSSGQKVERPRGSGLVGFVVTMVVLFVYFAYTDPDSRPRRPTAEEVSPAQTSATPETPEGFEPASGPEFQWWVAVVALLAASAFVAYERSRRTPPALGHAVAGELEDVLSQTLTELEFDPDPRRAVIQAYVRMETVLGEHGHARRPHEAPLEYLARVLRELDVRAEAAHALTELFERARFSNHEIDAAMRAEAVASLEAVRDDLRAAA